MTAMDRRAVLRLAGAGASLAGCLGDPGEGQGDGDRDGYGSGEGDADGNGEGDGDGEGDASGEGEGEGEGTDAAWEYAVPGEVVALHDGTVYGREDFTEGSGGIVALDASTGARAWTFGETGGYSAYTRPAVGDALYFGYGDDAIGSGSGALYAVEHDGTERWVADTGSVYDRPHLRDGTVYAGSDDGVVYGFDADGGDEGLSASFVDEDRPAVPSVAAVEDGVAHVTLESEIRALDVGDGEEIWRYEAGERRVSSVAVVDAVYFATAGTVGALAGGEERWTRDLDGDGWTEVWEVAHGAVYVARGGDLYALDAGDGSTRWQAEGGTVSVHEDGVFVATDRLRALTTDGEEEWAADLDGSEVGELVASGGSLYAATGEAVYRLDRTGEVVSSADVPDVGSLLVGDLVYVGTGRGMYGLAL